MILLLLSRCKPIFLCVISIPSHNRGGAPSFILSINQMTSFSCVTPFGGDLCFQGGVCSGAGNRSSCSCPGGWGRDYFLYHFDNCALPDKIYAIAYGIFGILTSLFLFAGAIFFRKAKQGKVKSLILINWFTVLCLHGLFLGAYVQDGCFELCTFSGVAYIGCQFLFISDLIVIFLNPLFSLQLKSRKLDQLHELFGGRFNRICGALVIVPFLILLPIYSHNDQRIFNLLLSLFFIELTFAGIIMDSIALVFTQKLIADIDAALVVHRTEALQAFRKRLSILSPLLFGGICIFIFLILPLPIVHLILGSIPFSWVVLVCGIAPGSVFSLSLALIFLTRGFIGGSGASKKPSQRRIDAEEEAIQVTSSKADAENVPPSPGSPMKSESVHSTVE